ncbi:MAG: hypothetical protein WCP53_02715, partial [Verrucomicrobiota bacterium]
MNQSCLLGLMLLAAPAFAEDPPLKPATAAKESQSTTVIDAENRELKPHDVLGFLIDQDPSVVEALRGGNGGSGDAETIF